MKTKYLPLKQKLWWLAMVLLVAFSISCEKASLEPVGGQPVLAAFDPLLPLDTCSAVLSGDLADGSGALFSSAGFGSGPYGTWSMFSTQDSIILTISLGYGWYASQLFGYVGSNAGVPRISGEPALERFPIQYWYRPVKHEIQLVIPVTQAMRCPNGELAAFALEVCQLDFLGYTTNCQLVWIDMGAASIALGTQGQVGVPFCAPDCESGPEVSALTGGNCVGCNSSHTVTFVGCDSVSVVSCRGLNNVVLGYDDCTTHRITGLGSATSASFVPHVPGKQIVAVWVRSGCNLSGEGPGFGLRYDNPNGCSVPCMVYSTTGN